MLWNYYYKNLTHRNDNYQKIKLLLKGEDYEMRDNVRELEKQIAEKNSMLKSLAQNEKRNREKIKGVKWELDQLLYRYYKSIKCKNIVVGLL